MNFRHPNNGTANLRDSAPWPLATSDAAYKYITPQPLSIHYLPPATFLWFKIL